MKLTEQDGLDYLNNAIHWVQVLSYEPFTVPDYFARSAAIDTLRELKQEIETDIWRHHASDKFGRYLKEVHRQFWHAQGVEWVEDEHSQKQ